MADSKNPTSKTAELDTSGLTCPLPVLRTRRKLAELEAGDLLRVIATDPLAKLDMAHFCQEAGHELVSSVEQDQHLIFLIRHSTR